MKKSYTVFLRYVCVAGLFNVTYSRITRDENLFVKTNFVCDLDDNSGIIERSGKTSLVCVHYYVSETPVVSHFNTTTSHSTAAP